MLCPTCHRSMIYSNETYLYFCAHCKPSCACDSIRRQWNGTKEIFVSNCCNVRQDFSDEKYEESLPEEGEPVV